MLGKVQLYTGDGKGKTTAALGLAFRAAGHGYKTLMIQFMKGSSTYGELKSAAAFDGLKIVQFGSATHVKKGAATKADVEEARKALAYARTALSSSEHHIVILDEINVAVDFGLIPVGDVVELIKSKASGVELVLTGRYAPPELVAAADLVSEVVEVKHYYRDGQAARKGVEY